MAFNKIIIKNIIKINKNILIKIINIIKNTKYKFDKYIV